MAWLPVNAGAMNAKSFGETHSAVEVATDIFATVPTDVQAENDVGTVDVDYSLGENREAAVAADVRRDHPVNPPPTSECSEARQHYF